MADPNIILARDYLNNYYGGHPYWIPIESEHTGVELITGIIRAFQITTGIADPTGNVGPNTIAKMRALSPISKMDPYNDDENPLVSLIQCALFAKGYAAGGITGIYYNNGVNAVKTMQKDAGLSVTGVIDWKVWAGLLSFNWFTMSSFGNGDSKLQQIQKQLNGDYSDYIGVQACDGIMSRNTALSLLGALQAELGVINEYILNLNELNFGEQTKATYTNKVGQLMSGNNDESKIPYNKIMQYGLYFNGFDSYNFEGNFDYQTKVALISFQKKYALLNNGKDNEGVVGVSTMMSLITSKGDTTRRSLGCDCSTVLNKQQAHDLRLAGYKYVGRYLTGTVGYGSTERSKALTLNEIQILKNEGLSIFAIYQDGGTLNHFKNSSQGYIDAIEAIKAAKRLGFTSNNTIYFAVDFDCSEDQAIEFIEPYFKAIYNTFTLSGLNTKNYQVGIYAPRMVCTMMSQKGYTKYSFVSDMSTGFVGNLGHPIPDDWAFDQFYEMVFPSSPSFDLDKVAVSNKDLGCLYFDEGKELTEEEKLKEARNNYTRNILKTIQRIENYVSYDFNYDGKEILIGSYFHDGASFTITFSTGISVKVAGEKDYCIEIEFDENGKFSNEMLDKIGAVLNVIDDPSEKENVESLLKEFALSAETGNLLIRTYLESVNTMVFELTAQTDDLYESYGVHGSVSDTLKIKVTFIKGYNYNGITFTGIDSEKVNVMNLNDLAGLGYYVFGLSIELLEKTLIIILETIVLSFFKKKLLY